MSMVAPQYTGTTTLARQFTGLGFGGDVQMQTTGGRELEPNQVYDHDGKAARWAAAGEDIPTPEVRDGHEEHGR